MSCCLQTGILCAFTIPSAKILLFCWSCSSFPAVTSHLAECLPQHKQPWVCSNLFGTNLTWLRACWPRLGELGTLWAGAWGDKDVILTLYVCATCDRHAVQGAVWSWSYACFPGFSASKRWKCRDQTMRRAMLLTPPTDKSCKITWGRRRESLES